MNRKELAARAAELLRENNIRKPVKIKKHTFIVTDEDGNSASFVVKRADKMVQYSTEDMLNAIDALIAIVRDSIQHGEPVTLKNFGTILLHKRSARRVQRPDNGEWIDLPEYYAPFISFSKTIKTAAKLYELSTHEAEAIEKLHKLELDDLDLDESDAGEEDLDFDDLEW